MVNKELLRLEEKENMEHRFDAYVRLIIRRRVKNQIRNYIRYCRRYDVVSMDDMEKLSDGYEEMMPEAFKLYAGNYLIVYYRGYIIYFIGVSLRKKILNPSYIPVEDIVQEVSLEVLEAIKR